MNADVLSIDGKKAGTIVLPNAFSEAVRHDLIRRAVDAENSTLLQPQGHYVLAGMQTTATYYGAMHSYRTGRHMGIAIRPREKLGGGVQGKVKRIPSAVKGKRAHPHTIEKTIVERINKKEYRKALSSAIAATSKPSPIIVSDSINSIKKTSDMAKLIKALTGIDTDDHKSRQRKGLRRGSKRKTYGKKILIVCGEQNAMMSARNIAGVDACTLESITVGMFAPGGNTFRKVIWSESAIKGLDSAIDKKEIRR